MKERPILFSGPMVRAVLEGRKTQTRRVVKPQPDAEGLSKLINGPWMDTSEKEYKCPYGHAGDRLWVRETWWHHKANYLEQAGFEGGTITRLDGVITGRFRANQYFDPARYPGLWRKRPSIHMPRWASRITLEITNVRVERLQDISEENGLGKALMMILSMTGHVNCGMSIKSSHNVGSLMMLAHPIVISARKKTSRNQKTR